MNVSTGVAATYKSFKVRIMREGNGACHIALVSQFKSLKEFVLLQIPIATPISLRGLHQIPSMNASSHGRSQRSTRIKSEKSSHMPSLPVHYDACPSKLIATTAAAAVLLALLASALDINLHLGLILGTTLDIKSLVERLSELVTLLDLNTTLLDLLFGLEDGYKGALGTTDDALPQKMLAGFSETRNTKHKDEWNRD